MDLGYQFSVWLLELRQTLAFSFSHDEKWTMEATALPWNPTVYSF